MINLSVYLVVQDEELRIKKTMDALVKVADEIVVVDSGSTDKTESIVREYTDKFYYNKFISIGHQVKVAEDPIPLYTDIGLNVSGFSLKLTKFTIVRGSYYMTCTRFPTSDNNLWGVFNHRGETKT